MDKYTLTARFFPMVIFYLPAIIVAILYSLEIEKFTHLTASLGVVAALSYFTAQIGRKGGNMKQSHLWKSWGGAPSIQLLRWRNALIDNHTKKRYHLKLQSLCVVHPFPNELLENSNPSSADEAYAAWTKYLIAKTRDIKKFPLVFRENINYGFWRNLWALKPFALSLITSLMIAIYAYHYFDTRILDPTNYPLIFFIAEGILFLLGMVWIFVVKASDIKIPAFAYAHRLLEAVENL